METQQLLSIYPQATISPRPSVAKNMVCVAIDAGKYICIDTTNLSNRELSLLELLTHTKSNATTGDAWSEFLTGRHRPPRRRPQKSYNYYNLEYASPNDMPTVRNG